MSAPAATNDCTRGKSPASTAACNNDILVLSVTLLSAERMRKVGARERAAAGMMDERATTRRHLEGLEISILQDLK
jgi:hypothetical protein